MGAVQTKRQKIEVLRSQLDNEFSSFKPHYQDLSDYILPRRSRFLVSDVNKGDRRNLKIVDSTATLAARTLRSGMMSGVTSPARPWFRLTTPDPDLAEFGKVKEWLYKVSQRMSTSFLRSNLYNTLPTVYGDMGVFGTAAFLVEEDFESVFRCQSFPVGSYRIAKDFRGRVNVFFREFRMTIRQIIEQFAQGDNGKIDWSKLSTYIKAQYDAGQMESWIDVSHVIKPNDEYDGTKSHSKFKKFASCYFETGKFGNGTSYMTSADEDKYLRESGYDYFPVLCPRWEVAGEDVYGTSCPGIDSLGDIKALQLMQKRKSQAIEKMVNPPMVGPSAMRTTKTSILPGDMTYDDTREGGRGFRPAHEVNPRIQELLMDIQDYQGRVKRSFFEDLFLMMLKTDRRDITAREIDERSEEKLLVLGPVLEQLNQDGLDPLIDITFAMHIRQRMLPEPPDELKREGGLDLKVEYISIMAQAQKLVGISGIERFAGFAGQVIAASPSSAKKINSDQLLDVYADITSIPPGIVRTDEEVAEMAAQEQKAQQTQQRLENIQQGAAAARDLSQSSTEGDNALTRLMDQAQAGSLVPQ